MSGASTTRTRERRERTESGPRTDMSQSSVMVIMAIHVIHRGASRLPRGRPRALAAENCPEKITCIQSVRAFVIHSCPGLI